MFTDDTMDCSRDVSDVDVNMRATDTTFEVFLPYPDPCGVPPFFCSRRGNSLPWRWKCVGFGKGATCCERLWRAQGAKGLV